MHVACKLIATHCSQVSPLRLLYYNPVFPVTLPFWIVLCIQGQLLLSGQGQVWWLSQQKKAIVHSKATLVYVVLMIVSNCTKCQLYQQTMQGIPRVMDQSCSMVHSRSVDQTPPHCSEGDATALDPFADAFNGRLLRSRRLSSNDATQ